MPLIPIKEEEKRHFLKIYDIPLIPMKMMTKATDSWPPRFLIP
jgi:hypothetical protein